MTDVKENVKKISADIRENERYIQERCENCADILIRPMRLGDEHKVDCLMVYIEVAVSNTSGAAGIAHWIDSHYRLKGDQKVDKNSELVKMIKSWVDQQYEDGRVTVLCDTELEAIVAETCQRLGITLK